MYAALDENGQNLIRAVTLLTFVKDLLDLSPQSIPVGLIELWVTIVHDAIVIGPF